jgi:DNA-binding transcriptional LysR family regulator
MDRFASMATFVAVIEAGSFSAASRKLAVPLATVSRKVSDLEDFLGVSLINRTTRKISLTEVGRSYYDSCRRLLDELGEMERAATGEYRTPRGELVLTAPIVFGRMHLAPIIVDFLKAYPEVDVRLQLEDRVVNLNDEAIDLAVRISELPDSSQMAVRVGLIRYVVCATPAYLAEHGTPAHPRELIRHDCVTRTKLDMPDAWPFKIGSQIKSFPVQRRLSVNTAEAGIEAVLAGGGLARVLCYQIAQAQRDGKLVTVLGEFEPPPLPLSLVYPSTRVVPMKLRAFLDFTVPRLKQRLQQLSTA